MDRLKKAISLTTKKSKASNLPKAIKYLVWELMKTQTRLKKLEKKLNGQSISRQR